VWTDLYIWVERLVEGDRNARMRLDKAPWGFEKFSKRAVVYATWLVIAVGTGGAWVFYFADAPTLFRELFTGEAAPIAYITVGVLTATTFTFAGFMREQVCTYMCPWPRIQGAMLDEDSLLVTYNAWRGEPRSHGTKRAHVGGVEAGDCIDCNACVVVCPQGIDIRDGNQLECITCALCIDACNDVMRKVERPEGLISYTTLRDYNAHTVEAKSADRVVATAHQRTVGVSHIVRPRTLIYAGLWSLIGVVMLVALLARDRLDLNVLADRNPLFVTLSDGSIRNGYTLKALNMLPEPRRFSVSIDGLQDAVLWPAGTDESAAAKALDIEVEPDRLKEVKVFVRLPREAVQPGRTPFSFNLIEIGGDETASESTEFFAPER
jgi:cytochrome c oxidase accessory protein FixG